MKRSLMITALVVAFGSSLANAAETSSSTKPVDSQRDVLVKLKSRVALNTFSKTFAPGSQVEDLGVGNWVRVQAPATALFSLKQLSSSPNVAYVQPNYKVYPYESPSLAQARAQAKALYAKNPNLFDGLPDMSTRQDNPAIPMSTAGGTGADSLASKMWGMKDIGVEQAWQSGARGKGVIVAVIDTGVDYTHEDLVENMWRNPGEDGAKANNGIDDDGNGFVDDVVGWDFVANDNKPFDLAGSIIDIVLKGKNPGHGTHCAGNVAARGNNGKGIYGAAPEAQIMALRFISTDGQGTTADAVKAITYAVKNGAKVLSNSWGSRGEDPNESADNKALRDAVQMAEDNGVLFVAAAGNGDEQGKGYSNDGNAKASMPASYPHESIISVAAMDSSNNLGSFSNWGATSVDIGAPGVVSFSTVVQAEKYTDTLVDLSALGMPKITWDGTSMATPHVAGAAALYWSAHPTATWREVKNAIMKSAKPTPSLAGKVVSGGRLDAAAMMAQ